jgi:AraC-like DNA-binding protein
MPKAKAEPLVEALAWSGLDRAVRHIPGGASAIFREAGVAPDVVGHHGRDTPFRKYVAYFEIAARMAADPQFGLRFGSRTRAECSGLPGHLLLNARRFRNALHDLAMTLPVLVDGVEVELAEAREPPALLWTLAADVGPAAQFLTHAGAYFIRMMQAHRGRRWKPLRLLLTVSCPGRVDRYRSVLGCPVVFDAPVNAIEFARTDLAAERAEADPHLHALLKRYASLLLSKRASVAADNGVETAVRRAVRDGLVLGRFDVCFVAERLNMSPRALQRTLSEEKLSFSAVRSGEQLAYARVLLSQPTLPIGLIASKLGYAETAAFSRAFQRWSGMSPRDARRAQQSQRAPMAATCAREVQLF